MVLGSTESENVFWVIEFLGTERSLLRALVNAVPFEETSLDGNSGSKGILAGGWRPTGQHEQGDEESDEDLHFQWQRCREKYDTSLYVRYSCHNQS